MVAGARDLNRAETGKMGGDELGVQEDEFAEAQAGDEMEQGDFEASVSVENMLSPKNAPPRQAPYSPPTSLPFCQVSTLWAKPRR